MKLSKPTIHVYIISLLMPGIHVSEATVSQTVSSVLSKLYLLLKQLMKQHLKLQKDIS